jgi:glutamate-1-semialdehyde 2,1-aminomutase
MSNNDLFERASRVIPGGVHSPVRSWRSVGGTPFFTRSARGAYLHDTTGRRYLDFGMAFGPLILGHRPPQVWSAVREALSDGWSYGTAETRSLELAEFISAQIPWVESIRFVTSGTEAVMTALRLARAATGRAKLLKFDGCYHGHADAMLIRAGSGLAGQAEPDSAGIPSGISADTLVAPLDDSGALDRIFASHGAELAAAIIEPLPANYGLLPQRPEFLQRLRDLCKQHGALLIFDEVITGFRVAFGGYAQVSGVVPDLVTYGKIIGGGFPVGAFGGPRDLMRLVAPTGPVYQAGTLAANPVAMAAGLATLHELADGAIYAELEALGATLEQSLRRAGLHVQRHGSIFWLYAGSPTTSDGLIRAPARMDKDALNRYSALFQALLAQGIYLPPSPHEVAFLSAAHRASHIRSLVGAALAATGRG